MKYQVTVEIQDGVLDPEMSTLQRHLERGGEKSISQIKKKVIYEIEVSPDGQDQGEEAVKKLAEDILANPEIHRWNVSKI